jgi:hypothetical protein
LLTDVQLLKECADELDMGTQYHLTRFAFLYETTVVGEGSMLSPMGADDGQCFLLALRSAPRASADESRSAWPQVHLRGDR